MKEITDEQLSILREKVSLCNPLVQSLVRRLDRVEGELKAAEKGWRARCTLVKAFIDLDKTNTSLRERLDRVEKERDALEDLLSGACGGYAEQTAADAYNSTNTALRERVKRMEEAFSKYGRHQKDCPCASWIFVKPECTCAYEAALKEGE